MHDLREKVARIVDPEAFDESYGTTVYALLAKRRETALTKADAILEALEVGRLGQLEEIAALARELITTGMVNRGVDRGLVVVEKTDRSDPHYRLCSALAQLPTPPEVK